MKKDEPVTRETIDRLCALADLPLPAPRREKLVPMLSVLITAANELNRKVAGRRGIVPITRFPER